ncbi:MAG: DUF3419 family protein [Candidatus Aminicenantales bacterium]
MSRPKIRYAQCWEDPRLSREALEIGPEDNILSIASGGENALAFLLDRPKSVTIIDRNPAQMYLVELKVRAVKELGHDDLLGFIGVRPGPDKGRLYDSLRAGLSRPALAFWDGHKALIREGLFHCGQYERFFRAAFRYVFPLVHSRKTLRGLFACSTVEEQAVYYRDVWTNRRWRTLFRFVFGKNFFGRLGRRRSHYRYVTAPRTWQHLYDRATQELNERLVREHPGLAYFFKESEYPRPENYPLWLQAQNFPLIREGLDRLRLRIGSVEEVLGESRPGDYSKFNLSNIFEYMSPEAYEAALAELLRVSKPGGRIAFWTLFVPRPVPEAFAGRFAPVATDGVSPAYRTWTLFEDFQAWEIL